MVRDSIGDDRVHFKALKYRLVNERHLYFQFNLKLTNLNSSALKRLKTPTNQRLALLFNNAIGPEREPMGARLTLLEFELIMIRRSPAVAGDRPSYPCRGKTLHCNGLAIIQIAVKKIAFFPSSKENGSFSSLEGKKAIFFTGIWIITNELQ